MGQGEDVAWEYLSIEEFNTREGNFHEKGARLSSIIWKKMKN